MFDEFDTELLLTRKEAAEYKGVVLLRVTGLNPFVTNARMGCTDPVFDGIPGVIQAVGRGRSVSSEAAALAGVAETAR
jgi:hypothetical protein